MIFKNHSTLSLNLYSNTTLTKHQFCTHNIYRYFTKGLLYANTELLSHGLTSKRANLLVRPFATNFAFYALCLSVCLPACLSVGNQFFFSIQGAKNCAYSNAIIIFRICVHRILLLRMFFFFGNTPKSAQFSLWGWSLILAGVSTAEWSSPKVSYGSVLGLDNFLQFCECFFLLFWRGLYMLGKCRGPLFFQEFFFC